MSNTNIPMDRQLPFCDWTLKAGSLPYAVAKQPSTPLINLGNKWTCKWWWWWCIYNKNCTSRHLSYDSTAELTILQRGTAQFFISGENQGPSDEYLHGKNIRWYIAVRNYLNKTESESIKTFRFPILDSVACNSASMLRLFPRLHDKI